MIDVYRFYCAQLEGEQTKHKLTETGKWRAHMTMDWFKCDGWLFLTINANNLTSVVIWITHYWCHCPYVDISISEDIAGQIEKLKDLPALKVDLLMFSASFPSAKYP